VAGRDKQMGGITAVGITIVKSFIVQVKDSVLHI
jgi:hypothetical protein